MAAFIEDMSQKAESNLSTAEVAENNSEKKAKEEEESGADFAASFG